MTPSPGLASPLRVFTRPPRGRDGRPALAERLHAAIRGEVRLDPGARALYATDASNYREPPVGVVVPRDADDVVRTLAIAREAGVAVLGRGAGTSLAGQTCNEGLVIDCSRHLNGILEVDRDTRRARVQPGVVLDDLRRRVAPDGLTFGPDPATHQYCTLGGMIANNSCGVHSVMAARFGPGPTTAHNLESLEVVTYRGARLRVGATDEAAFARVLAEGGDTAALYRQLRAFQERYAPIIRREFPDIPRRVSGYNLPALLPEHGFHLARALAGSESTLAMTLEATVTLIPSQPHRVLVVLGYQDVFAAADAVPDLLTSDPVALEGLDRGLADDLRRAGLDATNLSLLPAGDGWLLVEFGGTTRQDAAERAHAFVGRVARMAPAPSVCVYEDAEEQHRLWEVRESGLAATARVAGREPTWPGWEDSAVPPERLGAYLRDLRRLFDSHGYHADLYGHFGQGCVHCRIGFDLRTAAGIAQFRRFLEQAADLVHRHGGSLSGEHGDGQARGELLSRMFSAEMLQAFREFKRIWDPDGGMNPGKIVDARPLDAGLRLGTGYDPPTTPTVFEFPEDLGSFAHATTRCVGVGKCRKTDTGTMCPSYMVTREEQHSTRGRARLLFEMLEGHPLEAGWQSGAVHEALDLCLSCKGCKGECPVHVDMATYKAEFLSHYHQHHWRPRTALSFGRIGTWAPVIARLRAQRLVNTAARTPLLGGLARRLAGMAHARAFPAFAPRTFRDWFEGRPRRRKGGRGTVLLWPDTFNNHFHPETLRAAVEVLEPMGFDVRLPPPGLCCGRPLYDFGLLHSAKARLQAIVTAIGDDIRRGTPLVGLEPGCLSVFRDELTNLLPRSEQAHRLRGQAVSFGEFLDRHHEAPELTGLRLDREAVMHGHCHQKAVVGTDADDRVLDRLGLSHRRLDSGCCGMAGAFGFEAAHYDVSMAIGERALLPAVRDAAPDTLILADGFSCREQIAQATSRRALHLAEVVRLAMVTGPAGPSSGAPERQWRPDHAAARYGPGAMAAAGVAVLGAGIAAWLAARERRGRRA